MSAFAALVCAAAVAALLAFDGAGRRAFAGAAKVAASTAFLAVALLRGALSLEDGPLVMLALGFCWLGDVLLIGRARPAFLAGLVAFLLGHLAFGLVFAGRGVDATATAAAGAVYLVLGGVALRWLGPHVEPRMTWPVRAYVSVIGLMGTLAAGASLDSGDARLALGALLFGISDVFVARERFVRSSLWNRRLGLPLYYGSVLLLTWALT